MKQVFLIMLLIIVMPTVASPVESVYFGNGKVHFNKNSASTGQHELLIFLNKKTHSPSYKFNILLDEQLIDAALYRSNITIVLQVRNTYHLMIINTDTGKLVDNFWGFFAALSPNGRFIVYTRWRSKHEKSRYGMATGVTRIYDTTKSPLENRTIAAQQHLKTKQVSLAYVFKDTGLPVYPLGDFNQPSYGFVQKREDIAGVYGQYHWYQDNAFVFVTPPFNDSIKIIDATLDTKANKFVVKERELQAKDLVADLLSKPTLNVIKIEKTTKGTKLYTDSSIIQLRDSN